VARIAFDSVVLVVGLATLASAVGCQPRGNVVVREQVVRTADGLVLPGPFAPKAMRVHPLTHGELDADGNARVVLHVELKDAWGDTTKGVGRVQVQLWRDGGGAEEGERWAVDLRSLGENASFYDSDVPDRAGRVARVVRGGGARAGGRRGAGAGAVYDERGGRDGGGAAG
jgi:hypothetical protein